jgi:hypothetical protein
MKVAVLGTGMVGETIATKLIELGHQVQMGSRSRTNEKALAWQNKLGERASVGTFAEAAAFGELLFLCTQGAVAIDVLTAAGAQSLRGKTLIDLTNPIDLSKGMPPTLFVCNDDSLGERVQRAFPELKVVKTLNTVNCQVMVEPTRVPGDHSMFLCGNDEGAKAQVRNLLQSFGWTDIIDLGGISNARGTESWLPLWARLWGVLKTSDFNIKLVR